MENNPKKSKAFIITIIVIIVIILAGYLIFKNRDSFGVKASATIAKIFSPLMPSENNANLTTVDVQAGEDIAKGDSVSVFGTGTNNNPIVVKTSTNNGAVYGYANQNIKSGYAGKVVIPGNTGSSSFWNSISSFITNIVTPNPVYQCNDKKDNDGDGLIDAEDPNCHIDGNLSYGWVPTHNDERTNAIDPNAQPTVTVIANPSPIAKGEEPSLVSWTSTNSTSCDAGDVSRGTGTTGSFLTGPLEIDTIYTVTCKGANGIASGSVTVYIDKGINTENLYPTVTVTANPISVTKGGSSTISWNSTNAKSCTLSGGSINGDGINNTTGISTGPLTTSTSYNVTCIGENGLINSDNAFVEVAGSKIPDLIANRVTPTTAVVNVPVTLSFVIKNIGNSEAKGNFPNYFKIKNTDTDKSLPILSIVSPSIAAKSEGKLEKKYTFNTLGNYSITFCADQNDPTDKGRITEASETNNCSDPVNFKVTDKIDSSNLPDLTASQVTPSTAFKNIPITLSSIITNRGKVNTNNGFSTYFSIKSVGNASVSTTKNITMPSLQSGISNIATIDYTFQYKGKYSIIACADKNNINDNGKITESDESNNCSAETIITISDAPLPPVGSTECNDGIDNDQDGFIDKADPDCSLNGIYDATRSESGNIDITITECNDGIDNDQDGFIDKADPDCSLNGIYDATRSESNNGDGTNPEENKCLLIAQHPLTFTDAEKAQLADLLRKYYIISNTLKNETDINVIYRDMDGYKSLIDNTLDLTKQCYLQTNNSDGYNSFKARNQDLNLPAFSKEAGANTNYLGPTTINGNPWYKNSTRGKTYSAITPEEATTTIKNGSCVGKVTIAPNPDALFGVDMDPALNYFNNTKKGQADCSELKFENNVQNIDDCLSVNRPHESQGGKIWGYPSTWNWTQQYINPGAIQLRATSCKWVPTPDSTIYEYENLLNVW